MQQVKGSVLKSRLAFVEQHAGKDGVERVLATLAAEDRAALRNLVAIQWCPFDLGKRLDDAIVQVLGHGKPQFFERLGAASAETNLTSVHKAFLTAGDPAAFLAKAPQIYRLYYDTGRREYARTGPKEAVLTTRDAETFSAPDCLTVDRVAPQGARDVRGHGRTDRRRGMPRPGRSGMSLPHFLGLTPPPCDPA